MSLTNEKLFAKQTIESRHCERGGIQGVLEIAAATRWIAGNEGSGIKVAVPSHLGGQWSHRRRANRGLRPFSRSRGDVQREKAIARQLRTTVLVS